MKTTHQQDNSPQGDKSSPPRCESCKWRVYAEKHPKSIRGRIWFWHTKWCPGWKAYQKWADGQKG